jgi:hypothetical protein
MGVIDGFFWVVSAGLLTQIFDDSDLAACGGDASPGEGDAMVDFALLAKVHRYITVLIITESI